MAEFTLLGKELCLYSSSTCLPSVTCSERSDEIRKQHFKLNLLLKWQNQPDLDF